MNKNHWIKSRLFLVATTAMLAVSTPVIAQIPSDQVPGTQVPSPRAPGTTPGKPGSGPQHSPSQHSAETVSLTMEQRHVIKEIIVKDMKIMPPADQAAKVPTDVGAVVPSGIPLQPMPVEVAAKVPQLKAHSFLVRDEKIVIVDPKDNRVAALVD